MTGPISIEATGDAPETSPAADAQVLALLESTAPRVLLFVACWIGIGLTTAVVLRRRGHEFGPNAALGAALGPVFVFLAFDVVRRRESRRPVAIASARPSPGRAVLVVAVGDLDDPESPGAALGALDGIGPVTVAIPVEFEVAERVQRSGPTAVDLPVLADLAESLAGFHPGRLLLPGNPEESVPLAVEETEADLVVLVGSDAGSTIPGLESEVEAPVVRAGT